LQVEIDVFVRVDLWEQPGQPTVQSVIRGVEVPWTVQTDDPDGPVLFDQ
jgi:hypothetical protein